MARISCCYESPVPACRTARMETRAPARKGSDVPCCLVRVCAQVALLLGFMSFIPTTLAADAGPAAILAPTGRLRAAINLGNPVLAQKSPTTGELGGVSVALARELARRLAVPVDLIPYDAAGKVTADSTRRVWDLAFVALDPERARTIAFTAPYVFIEGTYLVRSDSPFKSVEDLDRPGVRIAVGKGAAYDLFLTRMLKNAQMVRVATSAAAADRFLTDMNIEAAAGVRQALQAAVEGRPGFRVIEPGFTRIDQAMAIPKDHEPALLYLETFVAEMKKNGFIRRALHASGQEDVASD
jgi:polar amino acid transport system substrate-binding protein